MKIMWAWKHRECAQQIFHVLSVAFVHQFHHRNILSLPFYSPRNSQGCDDLSPPPTLMWGKGQSIKAGTKNTAERWRALSPFLLHRIDLDLKADMPGLLFSWDKPVVRRYNPRSSHLPSGLGGRDTPSSSCDSADKWLRTRVWSLRPVSSFPC